MTGDLPFGVSKYPHMGIPTAVAPTTKHINPRMATHVEYNGFASAISQTEHDPDGVIWLKLAQLPRISEIDEIAADTNNNKSTAAHDLTSLAPRHKYNEHNNTKSIQLVYYYYFHDTSFKT